MELRLIRHGPKNNDPAVHGTGVEALLDPTRLHLIISHAAWTLESIAPEIRQVRIESTPVDRAQATAKLEYKIISLDPRFKVTEPAINELMGSYAVGKGRTINLSAQSMVDRWANAKKSEEYAYSHGEHRPLYAWCECGFDNLPAIDSADPGISLREIACRVGTYVHDKLQESDSHDLILALGHSGDIEPFLYLCLEMMEGRDGSDAGAMVRWFNRTRGALEPLTGIKIMNKGPSLQIGHLHGEPGTELPLDYGYRSLGMEVLQEMSRWYHKNGESREVLEERLKNIPAAVNIAHPAAPLSRPNISAIIERVQEGRKQILVGTRWKPARDPVYSGCLEIPAGHIDAYENVYETVRREVFEETGLKVRSIKPDIQTRVHSTSRDDAAFAFVPLCGQQQLRGGKPWISYAFICEVEDTEPVPNLDEVKDVQWMDYEELKRLFDHEPERIFTFQLSALDFYFNYQNVYDQLICQK